LKARGDLENMSGRIKEALPDYRQALEIIRSQFERDPGSIMLKDRYTMMLVYVGDILARLHQNEEGRRLYSQGLTLARQLADRTGATPGDVQFYAEYLLDSPLDDLRNPAQAIAYARRAVEMTGQKQPEPLQLLARCYEDADDAASAVAIQQKAVALIPPSPERKAAEGRLARFQSELKHK